MQPADVKSGNYHEYNLTLMIKVLNFKLVIM